MSTRQQRSRRHIGGSGGLAGRGLRLLDPGETVALVARSRRELLLACHRRRLGHEDLEDCYSQATLELLTRARRGEGFTDAVHIANALEQKFLSRIHDRRRALNGRSPIQAALAGSLPIVGCASSGGVDVADARADVERLAFLRHDLRNIVRLSHELSDDQRLMLASQFAGEGCAEFCCKHDWSKEKYRKVAQRARARLLRLHMDESAQAQGDACVPSTRVRRISKQGHTYETSSPT